MLNHVIGSGAGVFPPFDDPMYQREVGEAAKLSGPRRFLTYGTLDARVDRMRIRQSVGYMPENDSFIGNMNGVRFVRYMAELAGLPPGRLLRPRLLLPRGRRRRQLKSLVRWI